jgi:hypothetical protein
MTFGRTHADSFVTGITASQERSALANIEDATIGMVPGLNGQLCQIKSLTELTTIAAAATTDTTIQIPAGAIVLGVSTRVTVAIPTAATFTVGDSGSAARYNTGSNVAVAANTVDKGTKAGAYYNASAVAVRITPNLTPGTNVGRVRVTIHYIEVTAPTS